MGVGRGHAASVALSSRHQVSIVTPINRAEELQFLNQVKYSGCTPHFCHHLGISITFQLEHFLKSVFLKQKSAGV